MPLIVIVSVNDSASTGTLRLAVRGCDKQGIQSQAAINLLVTVWCFGCLGLLNSDLNPVMTLFQLPLIVAQFLSSCREVMSRNNQISNLTPVINQTDLWVSCFGEWVGL